MNVFIVGSPIETAQALDARRLSKQIAECRQIIDALYGDTKAWSRHPATLQYGQDIVWLLLYRDCLLAYREGDTAAAQESSDLADTVRPQFHTEEFFAQMKRRLYTKDSGHYAQWAGLGTSHCNWYWSPSEQKIIKYANGKRQG